MRTYNPSGKGKDSIPTSSFPCYPKPTWSKMGMQFRDWASAINLTKETHDRRIKYSGINFQEVHIFNYGTNSNIQCIKRGHHCPN